MGTDTPPIGEGSFEALLRELLRRIPVDSPEWTDFNESDPGVTLVQLFEFLTENLLWQIDERQRRRRRTRRVAILAVGTAGIGLFLWTWSRARPQDPL
jgi:hypothetical protein